MCQALNSTFYAKKKKDEYTSISVSPLSQICLDSHDDDDDEEYPTTTISIFTMAQKMQWNRFSHLFDTHPVPSLCHNHDSSERLIHYIKLTGLAQGMFKQRNQKNPYRHVPSLSQIVLHNSGSLHDNSSVVYSYSRPSGSRLAAFFLLHYEK